MPQKRVLSWLQRGWNAFVDPEREERLNQFAIAVHRKLAQQRNAFVFSQIANDLEIPPEDRTEVGRRLYGRCIERAWQDGEVTDAELRSLRWVADAVGMNPEVARQAMRERAVEAFSTKMAAAFSDGKLDEHEHAQLDQIARTCGETAGSFFQAEFRNGGEGFLRQVFLRVWEDGRLDPAEWQAIQLTVERLGLSEVEFKDVIRAPAQQMVEHALADAKSDGEITKDEAQTLDWLLTNLIADRDFAEYVRGEVTHLKTLSDARRGNLPSLPHPPDVALRAGEIVHFMSEVRYRLVRQRGGELVPVFTDGVILITGNRIMFISLGNSFQLTHNSVLGYQRVAAGLEVQSSGKGAGRYIFKENSDLATEIWVAAIRKANQTLVADIVKHDARKISRDVRQRVWQRYGGRCAECNATAYLEFDHIIPVAKGGSNSESNIQILCRGCNGKKSDKI